MSKPKFTAGPWHVSLGGDMMPRFERMIEADKGRTLSGFRRVSTVARTFSHVGDNEAIANAHLLASSPDLYAALDSVPLPSTSLEYNRGEFIQKFYTWYEGVRAHALSKARGETS